MDDFGVKSKNSFCLSLNFKDILLFFFPQSFIALHFTCKSMMNFELVEYVLIPVKINCFSQGEKGIV